jgi:hypothetical protein
LTFAFPFAFPFPFAKPNLEARQESKYKKIKLKLKSNFALLATLIASSPLEISMLQEVTGSKTFTKAK